MKALVYDGRLHLDKHYAMPPRQANQATIRILNGGICNTDLELTRGYMGFSGVLGHEFVGVVTDGDEAWLNRRVVGEINVPLETCDMVMRGIPSQARNRVTVGIDRHQGAFAETLNLLTSNLYAVPDSVSNDQAVFVEPLAAACQILEAVHVSPRDTVIVVGAGKLGLLCAQVLRLTGANVQVVVRRDKPRQLLQKWGIKAVTRPDLLNNRAQIVVDATGTADGFAQALSLVEARGTIVLKSTYADLPTADLTKVVVDEMRVVGSRCGPFEAALRLLEAKLVDVESLIEARYGVDDALKAFDHAFQHGTLKILLDF
jgi:threonine dehydrogenase-like Zn-dependent dehydrogenase